MKKLILAAVFLAVGIANAKSYEVSVSGATNQVEVRYSTVAHFPSMCGLPAYKVSVERNRPMFAPSLDYSKILIVAEVNPRNPCLTAFGPHSGAVTFQKGNVLPSLPTGMYTVNINGEDTGTLQLTGSQVRFVPAQ